MGFKEDMAELEQKRAELKASQIDEIESLRQERARLGKEIAAKIAEMGSGKTRAPRKAKTATATTPKVAKK